MGRQPNAEAKVAKYCWIGFALVEAIALYALVIAFIITPIAERSMKQALILSDGDFSVFITRPISAGFLLLALAILVFGFKRNQKQRIKPEN